MEGTYEQEETEVEERLAQRIADELEAEAEAKRDEDAERYPCPDRGPDDYDRERNMEAL
jgi:hypothetical protein